MSVISPAMTPEQLAIKRAWPTVIRFYGDEIEMADLDTARGFVIAKIIRRLETASWDTLQLVIEMCEGETVRTPATVSAASGRCGRLSRIVARLGDGLRKFGRVAGAARVAPRLPARIAWLFAKRQAARAALWFVVVYLALVVILVERSGRNRIARASGRDGRRDG